MGSFPLIEHRRIVNIFIVALIQFSFYYLPFFISDTIQLFGFESILIITCLSFSVSVFASAASSSVISSGKLDILVSSSIRKLIHFCISSYPRSSISFESYYCVKYIESCKLFHYNKLLISILILPEHTEVCSSVC